MLEFLGRRYAQKRWSIGSAVKILEDFAKLMPNAMRSSAYIADAARLAEAPIARMADEKYVPQEATSSAQRADRASYIH